MKTVADSAGKVWVEVGQGETVMRFAITGMDGVAFAPGATVEIPDERIVSAIDKLGAAAGITSDEYRRASDSPVRNPARAGDGG